MLEPKEKVSPQELEGGQRALVRDLAWASVSGAFCGGVILAAFALRLGATPLQIGLLAAIPFFSQAAQWPAALLIERVRMRRKIGVLSVTAARVVVLGMIAIPFLGRPEAMAALMLTQLLIAVLNAVGACAVNSWLHQLIPHQQLGGFFARRLLAGTACACVATLAAGMLIDRVGDASLQAYGIAFAVAGLAGFVSSRYLAVTPEPLMRDAGPRAGMAEKMVAPFRDRRFRHLLVFLGAWTVASSMAAPFLTVYLIEQRGYPIGVVTQMWVASQITNALTLFLWGRLSDALSNKGVLAVALPVHFACMLLLTCVDAVGDARTQLVLLYGIHVLLGVATGGIGLATGNLGLKLAPPGQGTPYLAAIGLVSAFCGGVAPIVAGELAQIFQATELAAVIRWATPGAQNEMALLKFSHWEFVFGISAVLGLYVMHALSRIDEGTEVSERQVVQAFALEAWRSLNNMSSIAGALGNLFPFDRATERRKWWRERPLPKS